MLPDDLVALRIADPEDRGALRTPAMTFVIKKAVPVL
jgi:hypothetical protein